MQYTHMIESYFESANAHNVEEMLKYFSANAVVYDEGQEHHGIEAIGKWMKQTNTKYNLHYTLLDISETDNHVDVVASVSGTFPGSPLQLTSRFKIEGETFNQLECGV